MSTQAQLAANRANAEMSPRLISEAKIQEKLSTGPKTAEGKQKVAHNAVKSALTGATVLLPTDDAARYEQHLASTIVRWRPETDQEKYLVQTIADTDWRLQRIPGLISGTIALAHIRNTEHFENHPADLRPLLIEAHIEEVCARQLGNLRLQESRLNRQREKAIAELKELQTERRKQQLKAAAALYLRAQRRNEPFVPTEFGFEFSVEEIQAHAGPISRPAAVKKEAA